MNIVYVLLGLVLLLFGRTLYWVFVGIVGFLLGMTLAEQFLAEQQEWVQVVLAIGAGALGAIVCIFAQRLAFAVGGFYAGGYLALIVAQHFDMRDNSTAWFIAGGVIGAIVAAVMMDWAIIVLSSLAGSAAILAGLANVQMDATVRSLAFVGIAIVGIVVQSRRMVGPAPPPPPA